MDSSRFIGLTVFAATILVVWTVGIHAMVVGETAYWVIVAFQAGSTLAGWMAWTRYKERIHQLEMKEEVDGKLPEP